MPPLSKKRILLNVAAAGGAPTHNRKDLGFHVPEQEQSQWCWAATGLGIATFYNSRTPLTQCQIASSELGLACCHAEWPPACDRPWYLDTTLAGLGHYVDLRDGPMPYSDLITEIDAGRPVGVRIGWARGGGHFLAVVGYAQRMNLQQVAVTDPWFRDQPRDVDYDELVRAYRSGEGNAWTHSYLTSRTGGGTILASGTAHGRGAGQ